MNDPTDKNENYPVEVFSGTAWEVALVQSLLENAEIKAYILWRARDNGSVGFKGLLSDEPNYGIQR